MQPLPHDLDAEYAVLGSIIMSPETSYDILATLPESDFFLEKNRWVYQAIQSVHLERRSCDPVTLKAELTRNHPDEGWGDYINYLAQLAPDPSASLDYATIISDKSKRRKLIAAANKIRSLAHDESADLIDQLGESERLVFDVRGTDKTTKNVRPAEYMAEYLRGFDEKTSSDQGVLGIPTGFYDLDRKLNGLRPFHYVLAGRPGMGKSAFALNLCENVAAQGYRVLFFSMEMSHDQLIARRISSFAGISSFRIQRPWLLTSEEMERVYAAAGALSKRDLLVEATGGLTVGQIKAKGMRWHSEKKLDLIVVDHMHRMVSDRPRNRGDLEIGDIAVGLTDVYKSFDVPGVTLAQLSRSVESRSDRRPILSDLRESGAIEQEAFAALFLYRHEYYYPGQNEGVAELSIAKNREGETGMVPLVWDADTVTFRNSVPASRTSATSVPGRVSTPVRQPMGRE